MVSRCDGIAALSSLRHDAVIDAIGMLELAVDACCRVVESLTACVRASVVIVGTHSMTYDSHLQLCASKQHMLQLTHLHLAK